MIRGLVTYALVLAYLAWLALLAFGTMAWGGGLRCNESCSDDADAHWSDRADAWQWGLGTGAGLGAAAAFAAAAVLLLVGRRRVAVAVAAVATAAIAVWGYLFAGFVDDVFEAAAIAAAAPAGFALLALSASRR